MELMPKNDKLNDILSYFKGERPILQSELPNVIAWLEAETAEQAPLTFALTITLGNDGMRDGEDVAQALRIAAEELAEYGSAFGSPVNIRDHNGNTVGSWAVQ